jgi:hypothetical protein
VKLDLTERIEKKKVSNTGNKKVSQSRN